MQYLMKRIVSKDIVCIDSVKYPDLTSITLYVQIVSGSSVWEGRKTHLMTI